MKLNQVITSLLETDMYKFSNSGSGAQAASYIHMMDQDRKRVTYGVGISSNITRASLRGIFSAVNRLYGDN